MSPATLTRMIVCSRHRRDSCTFSSLFRTFRTLLRSSQWRRRGETPN